MTAKVDRYLDAINAGLFTAEQVTLSEYIAFLEESENGAESSEEPPDDDSEEGHHVTLDIVFTDHTTQSTTADTMHVNKVTSNSPTSTSMVGFSYGTRKRIVVTIEHPEV